jgi:hypothetical protein
MRVVRGWCRSVAIYLQVEGAEETQSFYQYSAI